MSQNVQRKPATHSAGVQLRPTTHADLPTLFRFQLDPDSNLMAGTKPYNEAAYFAHWNGVLADPAITPRTILFDAEIVGAISCFFRDGSHQVGYWIAREHWGKGIASNALRLLLGEVPIRPLHATAARSNAASIRILESCGFRCTGFHEGEETHRYLACEVASFVLD
jgi:RimJ/RimL family protein N-acetyltransferase